MSGPKPTLGYANRTEAVAGLRGQGHDTASIARLIGISASTVSALEHSATRSRRRAARGDAASGRLVLFPADVLASLRRPAAHRGISPNRLAGLIVEAVVDGKLIDAVLDDAEDTDG